MHEQGHADGLKRELQAAQDQLESCKAELFPVTRTCEESSAGPSTVNAALYQEAMDRLQRKQLKEEQVRTSQAIQTAKQASANPKINKTSLKMSCQRAVAMIEAAVAAHSGLEGTISKAEFLCVLHEIELFRELQGNAYADCEVYEPSWKRTRCDSEFKFLERAWALLSPGAAPEAPSATVSELLFTLFHPLHTAASRNEALAELKSQTHSTVPHEQLCREFFTLHQDSLSFRSNTYPKKKGPEPDPLSFQPSICKKSSQMAKPVVGKRYESLYSRQFEKEEKNFTGKRKALEEQLKDCTFSPELVSRESRNPNRPAKVAERLYELRNAPKLVQDARTTDERELEECTFKPQIKVETGPAKRDSPPKGFSASVQRVREATKQKEELKQKLERIPAGENYEKLRNSRVKQFSFLGRQKESREVLLYVDVNVAPGRTGRIAVHQDDSPRSLAKNFCKTYQLGLDMQETLEDLLRRQISDALSEG